MEEDGDGDGDDSSVRTLALGLGPSDWNVEYDMQYGAWSMESGEETKAHNQTRPSTVMQPILPSPRVPEHGHEHVLSWNERPQEEPWNQGVPVRYVHQCSPTSHKPRLSLTLSYSVVLLSAVRFSAKKIDFSSAEIAID